jgi:predicted heme/steroid binding protein
MRRFTKDELARSTGEDASTARIAFKGKVYDVTNCFLWQGGRHQALHVAGRDLTDELADAPHGEDLLERAVLVGTLEP